MKKFIFFLIIITGLLYPTKTVQASSSFYEAEYIDGIYMNKRKAQASTIYYQKARFFRQTGTNNFAYCIEPYRFFEENSNYETIENPGMFSKEQKERIALIAHFGYGYTNHQDKKWYAITQFMIWQASDPTGDFYFTDTLNGNKIERFTQEMAEINSLIASYNQNPSIMNKEYLLIEGQSLNIKDENNILNNYYSENSNFLIKDNHLTSGPLEAGTYQINLKRQQKIYNRPLLFYQSATSQALVETGDLKEKNATLKVKVIKTGIDITKIDKDTNSKVPSGKAQLSGAIFQLYDQNKSPLQTITIDENCQANIKNLPLGTYYLKEIKAGLGYQLNSTLHKIELTEDNPTISLTLNNEVIKRKIIIHKKYDENNPKQEAMISFDIFDDNNKKVATITTDEYGKAEITLPYGTYLIKQVNTTEGYHKVEDFKVIVDDITELIYNLTDYKIKVPNTKTSLLQKLISFLLALFQ